MTIGVLLTRRTHLKLLAPVLQAAQRRGHRALIIAAPSPAKRGDALDRAEVARLFPALPIEDVGRYGRLDCLIGVDAALPDLKATRMIGVDHFYDAWTYAPRRGRNRVMAYHSDWHRQQHAALWGMPPEGAVVGWLPADQGVRLRSQPRDSAVFFALKLDVPEPWRRAREGRHFYRQVFHQARDRARAEGLRFVVKSRAKHRDPWWLRWLADEYVLDTSMVPATSLALLSRAKWAVHFESGAGLEAALMGAYSVAVQVPQGHIINLPGGRLQYGGVAMHDWPGVASDWDSWKDSEVDPEQRAQYLEHFVGSTDGRAAERVVEIAEGA